MTEPVLDIRDLRVSYGDGEPAVHDLSLSVAPGEIVAVVGESGSGKSTAALAVLGLLPASATVTGSIELAGHAVLDLRGEELRKLRGPAAGMVFQEPMTALNPLLRVGFQLAEAIRNHDPRRRRHQHYYPRCVELLDRVGVPDAAARLRQYPHELSGGLRQRVLIAIALAAGPKLIIADEPTTALDVTVQQQILDLLRDIRDTEGTATLLITHNMGVVADVADRVLVLRSGRLVEEAPTAQLFAAPRAAYTRELLAAVPRLGAGVHDAAAAAPEKPVLALTDVVVEYGGKRAVDSVSLRVGPGEIVGLVGESGSGKTTLGNCALGLVTPKSGRVEVLGGPLPRGTGRAARAVRRQIGAVFQDPASSLDPRMTVAQTVAEPLVVHTSAGRAERQRRVRELLDAVELPESVLERYGHELSGGQRQRVSLARALVLGPKLLIADEPTSALDVSVQAVVLDVFKRLHEEFGFGCLFVSHDLAVVDRVCDRVAVLRAGEPVEQGPAARVLRDPEHPYTKALLLSSPVPDPAVQRARRLELAAPDVDPAA
ncbi:dipeptide ABC transporter ATP-binding protein [Amycolatopsis sp. NPDC051903]|uniref:dipeptide ABC transporter ATP-binding protein n=1 Tax=Amycolatopsis sp. NPDC051903 TaxID=3363936 RepID=UPI0037ADB0D2